MNRAVRHPIVVSLALGLALVAADEASPGSAALAGLVAAVAVGAAFPEVAFLAGAVLVVPQVPVAMARGAAESGALAAVALLAGVLAAGVNGILAVAGAAARRSVAAVGTGRRRRTVSGR